MTDYQSTQELAQEQAEYNSHLRAQEQAEAGAVRYAEATAANNGFSPVFEDAPEGYFESLAEFRKALKENVYTYPRDTRSDDGLPF